MEYYSERTTFQSKFSTVASNVMRSVYTGLLKLFEKGYSYHPMLAYCLPVTFDKESAVNGRGVARMTIDIVTIILEGGDLTNSKIMFRYSQPPKLKFQN